MKRLILCEKPSVARAVAIGLGIELKGGRPYASDEWIVEAARGHLLQLAEPERYDPSLEEWRAKDLPIIPDEPRWEPREDGEELLAHLLDLIRSPEVGEVVNACDAGREGELIFKLIFRRADVDKPVRRAWFSSLTPGAVRRAFEDLRDDREMRGLEAAAITRDIGDWLVGINGTRAVTVRARGEAGREARKGAVSVGRVQTPTLRFLVEREGEIDGYVPIPFYRVGAELEAPGAGPHRLRALVVDDTDEPVRHEDRARAEEMAAALAGRPAHLEAHDVERRERAAPLPFDLATLQVEAGRAFGWSAARVLRTAQNLYEAQFISYPRTDSRFLTWDLKGQVIDALGRVPEAVPELADEAAALARAAEAGTLSGRPFNAALVRDHHAVIPTGKSGADRLPEAQARLYELVARRFVAAFMSPAVEEHHRLRVRVGEARLAVSGWRLVKRGWRTVEPGRDPTDPEVLTTLEAFADAGREGREGTVGGAEPEERYPWRPRPYTDGSLIRAMERAGDPEDDDEGGERGASDSAGEGSVAGESDDASEIDEAAERHRGIGTPATRSGIIETLLRRRYARRHRSWIYATVRGRRLVDLLDDHELTSPVLTADWEERLEAIREGEESPEDFRTELEAFTGRTVESILDRPMERIFAPPREIGACPRCGGRILERDRAYGCNSWKSSEEPGCGWVVFRDITRGRVGRAEAEWRLANDRPHPTRKTMALAPAETDLEAAPDEMVAYDETPPDTESLDDPDDPTSNQAWNDAVREVVEVEGPVMARRILRVLRNRAEGVKERQVRRAVNRITAALAREGDLAEVDDAREPEGQQDRVFRLPGQPEVLMRERGPRDPLEIPRRELRAAWKALRSPGGEEGIRALAGAYAVVDDHLTDEYSEWFAGAIR